MHFFGALVSRKIRDPEDASENVSLGSRIFWTPEPHKNASKNASENACGDFSPESAPPRVC